MATAHHSGGHGSTASTMDQLRVTEQERPVAAREAYNCVAGTVGQRAPERVDASSGRLER